jgi:hypothetical protein
MSYVEFPGDEIIAVHFKKPDEPPDPENPPGGPNGHCGMVELGTNITIYFPDDLFAAYTLDRFHVYRFGTVRPGSGAPDQPYGYLMRLQEYVDNGITDVIPYVWNTPGSFTISILDNHATEWRISEYRNINPQRYLYDFEFNNIPNPAQPTRVVDGRVMEIQAQQPNETYPPFFFVSYKKPDGFWYILWEQHITIQAHCAETTIGDLPPQPPGYDAYDYYKSPMYGSINDPVTPPPTEPPTLRQRAMRLR